ncbi:hypothetical protein N6H18_14910 [Reichenbachiella agarivorans]|uniref:Uncharacterized protein n=1 Tax=Reichenbachiella agarivorans TaxID=2979464 RepID=A0ABY6CMA2_9BACT|nr:hypothetical protein [Reichenbachiella agarivorans]UXP31637.1 hypothetical protein N6H18_14910 [Reichenbachiella agarivorans]
MRVRRARLRDQHVNLANLLAETEGESKKNEDTNQSTKESDKPVTTKRSASRLILYLSGTHCVEIKAYTSGTCLGE